MIATVGILVLLALAATGLATLAGQVRGQAGAALDVAGAHLLAHSGIEYASARLFEDSTPKAPPTRGNQPDDWTYRDGADVPLEKARNPSYAQTEPYQEMGASDGRYDPSLEPYTDLNANARFDAWTGRLRGSSGGAGNFLLKVAGSGSKLSVNGGIPTDPTGYNLLDPFIPSSLSMGTSGRYWATPENGRIAEVLNTLMEVLQPLPSDAPGSGAALNVPRYRVGEKIIQGRPLGGYRSLEQVRRVLSLEEWIFLERYLTVETEGSVAQGVCPRSDPWLVQSNTPTAWYRPDRRRPVLLASADPALLEALFRDVNTPLHVFRRPDSSATGNPLDPLHNVIGGTIFPEDARNLARFLRERFPLGSRYGLYRELDRRKKELFPSAEKEWATARTMSNHLPVSVIDIQNQLVDIAFANMSPDDIEVRDEHNFNMSDSIYRRVPPLSWISYDVERPGSVNGPSRMERILNKIDLWQFRGRPEASIWWPGKSFNTYWPFGTLELSVSEPESAFAIESLGRIADRNGRLRSRCTSTAGFQGGRAVAARTQDDFENDGSGRGWGLPPGVSLNGRPLKDRTQTYPMFPRDSMPDWTQHLDFDKGSPCCGDVRLMHYSPGATYGAAFYAPMAEGGQPIRVPKAPSRFLENFRDVVSGAEPALSTGQPAEKAAKNLLESGMTAFSKDTGDLMGCRGAIPPGALFPAGMYSWGTGGNSPEGFPLLDPSSGTVPAGTLEYWSAESGSIQWNPMRAGLQLGDQAIWTQSHLKQSPVTGQTSDDVVVTSPGFYSQPDWHHLAVGFDEGGIVLRVDGIEAGRDEAYYAYPVDTTQPQCWRLGGTYSMTDYVLHAALMSEIRFYRERLQEAQVRGHIQPRFWTSYDAPAELDGLAPSYTSALYSFGGRTVPLTCLSWEGFVPKRVGEEADATGAGPPLRVELLCYDDARGGGEPRAIPLPAEAWREGGGRFPLPNVPAGSFRYRVWMDVSALTGFNNETPVFDSIDIGYRSGKRVGVAED